MALDKAQIDETKSVVLYELEKMFTEITHKLSSSENHDKLNFLLDIENQIKQKLMEIEVTSATKAGS